MIKLAICAIIKDTPDYLMKEWIEHHFKLGISGICVYVDVNSKPIYLDKRVEYIYLTPEYREELLEYGCKYGLRQNLATNIQIGVYNTFLNSHRNDYDWIAFIDDDEFLELNIEDLNEYKEETCVVLPWRMMYTPDIKCQCNLKNYKEFPVSQNAVNNYWKPIVNTKNIWLTRSVHHGDFAEVIFGHKELTKSWNSDQSGNYMYSDKFMKFIYDSCDSYIRHYKYRSFQEWIESLVDRGYLIYDNINKLNWRKTIKLYFDANPYFLNFIYNKENIDKLLKEIGREDAKNSQYYDWTKIPQFNLQEDIIIVFNGNDAKPAENIFLNMPANCKKIAIDYIEHPEADINILKNNFIFLMDAYKNQEDNLKNVNSTQLLVLTLKKMFPNSKIRFYVYSGL